jgi:low temperature requirement protein LtrA
MAAGSRGLLRSREEGEARVEFVELFFDLVFVLAITQLSHRLIEHPTLHGAAETLLLFVAIWWSWINTAWVTNWLDPHRTRVRLLLFAMMAAGLLVSMSIPEAFAARGLSFAGAYAAMVIGRSSFVVLAMRRHDPANHLNFIRILIWQIGAACLWVGGALADGDMRLGLWFAAVMLWSIGPIVFFAVPGFGMAHVEDWNVDPGHLAERCGLFIILALGESILVMGATFSRIEWDASTLSGFAVALAATVAMWWLYFNIGSVRAVRTFAASAVRGKVARLAYTYLHLPIDGGIIIGAAAADWVIAHPHGAVEPYLAWGVLGGPALYLAGNAAFKRATGSPYWPLSHMVGLGTLAALALVHWTLEPFQLGIAVSLMLVAVAIWETISLRDTARAQNH